MAVGFDAQGTGNGAHVVGASLNHAVLTVGSGSNRALVVTLSFDRNSNGTDPTGLAVKWDNAGTPQSLAQIVAANGTGTGALCARAELWGLVNPTSGNKTLNAAWTGTQELFMDAVAFTGVNQTGGATSFPSSGSTTGAGTSISRAQTTANGNATVVAGCVANTVSATNTQTEILRDNGGSHVTGFGSYGLSAGASNTHTFTQASGVAYVLVGTDVAAAAGGGVVVKQLSALGVG